MEIPKRGIEGEVTGIASQDLDGLCPATRERSIGCPFSRICDMHTSIFLRSPIRAGIEITTRNPTPSSNPNETASFLPLLEIHPAGSGIVSLRLRTGSLHPRMGVLRTGYPGTGRHLRRRRWPSGRSGRPRCRISLGALLWSEAGRQRRRTARNWRGNLTARVGLTWTAKRLVRFVDLSHLLLGPSDIRMVLLGLFPAESNHARRSDIQNHRI